MSQEDSIVEGLASTGTIISSAGLVMLASFGGLLFSVNPGLSQIGFMLCFAVATDTFVVEGDDDDDDDMEESKSSMEERLLNF